MDYIIAFMFFFGVGILIIMHKIGPAGKSAKLHSQLLVLAYFLFAVLFLLIPFYAHSLEEQDLAIYIIPSLLGSLMFIATIVTVRKYNRLKNRPNREFILYYPEIYLTKKGKSALLKNYHLRGKVNGEPINYQISKIMYDRLWNEQVENHEFCYVLYSESLETVLDVALSAPPSPLP